MTSGARKPSGPRVVVAVAPAGIIGLVRADYVPVWALAGLGFERLHDLLDRP